MVITQLGALAMDAAQRGDDRAADTLRDAIELLCETITQPRVLQQTTKRVGRQGYVYYAIAGDEVKIGYSRNPWARIKELRVARPTLQLAGIEHGDTALEVLRHKEFMAARLSREWFKLTDELRSHIESVAVRSDNNDDVATTSYGAPSVFPHTPFPTPPESPTPPPRERDEDAQLTEGLITLVSQSMGALWGDADAFIRRREYATWKGWLKEMQTLMVGGQATAADIAQVCRDDMALERPLGSPKGFRTFVGSAVRERLASHVTSTPRAVEGAGHASHLVATIRGLIRESRQPGQSTNRFIVKADVATLGQDVLKAYEAVGGRDRFVNITGDQMSFLIRDFNSALEAARAVA